LADGLTAPIPYRSRIPDWARYLEFELSAGEEALFGYFTSTGYPMGEAGWMAGLETKMSRRLTPGKRGRPRKPVKPGK